MAEIASLLANIATALGIPIAIIAFLVDRHRARRDRELETYRTLADNYFEYLKIVFDHPELSTTETEWSKARDLSQDAKQDLLVQMAVNLVEGAYFLYRGHRSSFRAAQWEGWEEYLKDWCAHPAFVARWPEVVEQYDEGFRQHVHDLYERVHNSPPNKRLKLPARVDFKE